MKKQLIDIDATLKAFEENESVLLTLEDGLALEIEVKPKEQLDLIEEYSKSDVAPNGKLLQKIFSLQKELGKDQLSPEDLEGHEDLMAEAMTLTQDHTDYYALGCEIAKYANGWQGFAGEFDKAKAVKFISIMTDYAVFLGKNFKAALKEYQQANLKRVEAERKNL
jgi:hypothetical protein